MSQKENHSRIANRVTTKQIHSLKGQGDQAEKANQFKQSLLDFNSTRKQTHNSYEKVITALESLVEDLFQKIDCLNQDRHVLLKQNNELRRNVQSLTNIIEVKQRLGQSVVVQNSQIFQIMVESSSVAGMSRTDYSLEFGNTVGNIMEQNEQIVNRQQFIIMSNPLSQNISQIEEGEISMSNIGGRTQTINPTNLQTPGLPCENIFIQCPATKADGIIRAFYLCAIQRQFTTNQLMNIIQSLTNDITMVIFEAYPTNQFWTEMLCNFLKIVREQHFDNQMQVLQYIKAHKLIDTLIIKCLKSRIEFLFYNTDSFEMPSIHEVLGALSNEFGLRMQICEEQYFFYTKQIKDENLLLSDRASVQISLNNKEENKYYFKDEEPCFVIMERADYLQFPFFISAETMLGISQYQLNEAIQNQHSFKYSEDNGYSLHLRENEIEMSRGQHHIEGVVDVLNEKDMNAEVKEEKQLNRIYRHKRERYETKSPQYHQPLSSSRYFLSRVGSKNSCFDENA